MRIFVLYRLRPSVSLEDYRVWSRDVDQPTLRGCPQVSDFRVYETRAADDAQASYSVVEVIDVDSPEAWRDVTERPDVKALGPAFEHFVDLTSLCILQGEEIVGR